MSKPEWWVMRVVVPGGAHITSAQWEAFTAEGHTFAAGAREIAARMRQGRYQCVGPDIAEPIEFHDDQETALAAMARHASDGRHYKVTLNMDVEHVD